MSKNSYFKNLVWNNTKKRNSLQPSLKKHQTPFSWERKEIFSYEKLLLCYKARQMT